MMRSRVDLPPPLRSEQRGELAGRDADRDVVEGDEVAEPLADADDLDAHRCGSSFGRMRDDDDDAGDDTSASRNAVA